MLTAIIMIIIAIIAIYFVLTQPKKLEQVPFKKADSSEMKSDLSEKERIFPLTAEQIEESLQRSQALIQEKLPTTRRLKKTELVVDRDDDEITPQKLFTQQGKSKFVSNEGVKLTPRTDFPLETEE